MFVLDYTVMDTTEKQSLLPYPCYDVANAVSYIHQHAEAYHIDRTRLTLLGCSAEGHLAAVYSNLFASDAFQVQSGHVADDIAITNVILCYPVLDMTIGWPDDATYC